MAHAAGSAADKQPDAVGQLLGDLPGAHEVGGQNEKGNGQQRGVVDAADQLLNDDRIWDAGVKRRFDKQCGAAQHEKHLEPGKQQDHRNKGNDSKHYASSSDLF